MSMTREEAIKWLEEIVQDTDTYWGSCSKALQKELDEQKQVFLLALSALRPVTREQVEKMRGEIVETVEKGRMKRVFSCCGCDFTSLTCWITPKFCPSCGAPLTDEAVDMVMERLEEVQKNEG